jgi:hypothetical protein
MSIHLRRSAVAFAAGLAVAVSGCALDQRPMDTHKAESAIKSSLQRQMRARLLDASLTVNGVSCKVAHERQATCVAHISDDLAGNMDINIAGNYNPSTGKLFWHTVR